MFELITFEEAKILKKLGFDHSGTRYYNSNGEIKKITGGIDNMSLPINNYVARDYNQIYWWLHEYFALDVIYSTVDTEMEPLYSIRIRGNISNEVIWEENGDRTLGESRKRLVRIALMIINIGETFIRI